jgi:TonB family protein
MAELLRQNVITRSDWKTRTRRRIFVALAFASVMFPVLADEAVPAVPTAMSEADSSRVKALEGCGVAPAATMQQLRDFDAKYSADYALYGDETPPADAKRADAAIRVRPVARYPASFAGTGSVGKVVVIIAISNEGKVTDSMVVCSNHPDFAASAIKGLKPARFKPQKNDGIAVASTAFLPFTFIER